MNERTKIITNYIDNNGFIHDNSSALELYFDWREGCLRIIAENRSLDSLMEYGSKLLNNPIVLSDEALNILARVKLLLAEDAPEYWKNVFGFEFYRPEVFHKEDTIAYKRWMSSGEKKLRASSPMDPERENLAIRCGNGILLMVATNCPISLGEELVLEDLAQFIELFMKSEDDSQPAASDLYYIRRLLNGRPVSNSSLAHTFAAFGWRADTNCCLACIRTDKGNQPLDIYLLKSLQRYRPKVLALKHADDIVVIGKHIDEMERLVSDIIRPIDASAGFAAKNSSVKQIYNSYIQARIALSYAAAGTFEKFENIYVDYIFETIFKQTERDSLCAPAVLKLAKEEGEKGQELVKCLRVFLINGRDIAKTARELHLHRNTLIYRLEKMQRLLVLDFNALSEKELFYLLMSCYIVDTDVLSKQ